VRWEVDSCVMKACLVVVTSCVCPRRAGVDYKDEAANRQRASGVEADSPGPLIINSSTACLGHHQVVHPPYPCSCWSRAAQGPSGCGYPSDGSSHPQSAAGTGARHGSPDGGGTGIPGPVGQTGGSARTFKVALTGWHDADGQETRGSTPLSTGGAFIHGVPDGA